MANILVRPSTQERMRILGHIHTLNDEDVIDRSLGALLSQTHPLDEILIVDNGSTDGTLQRVAARQVTVIRHEQNLGTNGAIITGFRYALARCYDWVWVFDADSAPSHDALQKLIELYRSFPVEQQDEICFLACLPLDGLRREPLRMVLFTPSGLAVAKVDGGAAYYRCDVTIWSGCLYQMKTVNRIGLPSPDYVLDWGEFEYGYRAMRAGYKSFVHSGSTMAHNIGGQPSLTTSLRRLGPFTLKTYEFPPIRCYYMLRNMIHFSLWELRDYRLYALLRLVFNVAQLTLNFLLRPKNHRAQIWACFRGIWDGLTKSIHRRF
jgi:rhamnopyranosyl-N-acetylglucosaminyl-diphospho-decaprenol beta-1,3/1,4-galactofuranosyltransferase